MKIQWPTRRARESSGSASGLPGLNDCLRRARYPRPLNREAQSLLSHPETELDEPDVAIALRYDGGADDLPRISAAGRGPIARQILAVADRHGVAVRRDRALAEVLAPLEIGSAIPVAAFAAVAEILAHLYRTDRALAAERRP